MRRLALFLALALLTSGARAQVVMEEIGTLQESFAAAQQAFSAYQFPKAIASLDPLIATLTRWESSGRLQPSDEALLEKSLELRGVCAYNVGKLDLAKQDFTRLIDLRPEYPFSVTKAPKIQRYFEDLRASLTGTLDLTVDPPESEVSLDGRKLGAGNPRTLPVLKGLHIVRVTHPGYDPEDREVNVEIGATSSLAVKLTPNARTIYFFVRPEGTELYVDGRLVGRAERAASSSGEGLRFLRDNGLDVKDLYVIQASYLNPGDHKVSLRRQCYKGREFLLTVVLDKVNNAPGFIRPIDLEHRTVEMEVTSHPSGSRVVVDGQALGDTPLKVAAFCIGRHDFVIQKPGVGEYRSTIDVPDVSPFELEATLRPSLLWVGWTRNQEVTPDQLRAASDALAQAFRALKQFNAAVADERNPLLPDTFFTPGVGAQDQSAAVKDLCARYGCQGLVAGKLSADASGRFTASLRLFVPGLPGYDEKVEQVAAPEAATALLAWLDRPLFGRPASKVLTLVDLPGAAGPTFVRGLGIPDGPAAGDVLLAVDTTTTRTAAAARTALDAAGVPALRLLHRGQERVWILKPSYLYEVTPYGGITYGYRHQWLLARQAVLGSESPVEKLYALMNLASAELNLGRPAEALRALEAAEPGGGGGLGPAAVGYLKAVALVQLDRLEEARPLLLAAAGDASGSLDGLGQVLIQPLAADILRQLPPPPPPPAPPVKK